MLSAIADANTGHALAYGEDDITRACEAEFAELFDADVRTFVTVTGTGANVVALAALLRPADAVVCARTSHINLDETGAPERFLGTKLIDLGTKDGKLVPDQVSSVRHLLGNLHHVQPAVLSITQSTELGAVYSPAEMAALCEAAHDLGMRVHVDGARIANAVAALGGDRATLRSITVDAGVDVISFGGTKNGLMGAEAVVFLQPALADRALYLRKQATQLASKMRFVSAQLRAVLHDDLWIDLATHANAMAYRLWEQTKGIDGVEHEAPPEVNSLFPVLPLAAIAPLQQWCFFWEWEADLGQVRWMTSWDTTDEDIEEYAGGIRHYLASAID